MNKAIKYITFLLVALFPFAFYGCTEDVMDSTPSEKGTLLNLYVDTGVGTRLAELPADKISEESRGKKNIGLYIYYEDDYKSGNVKQPYVRNLECKVDGNRLTPVDGSSIYIYDRMTIVAFYPYNKSVDNFTSIADETGYPITESDYEEQTYIPYRAQTNVDPTNAFMIILNMVPQQTFKIQLVLVADQVADFPVSQDRENGSIKLLPSIDPRTASYEGKDRREFWIDEINNFAPGTGGKHVRRYNAFIWKSAESDKHHDDSYKHDNNKIEKGELLFQSNELTLLVPEAIDFSQRTVYRYGYNMNTGEVFVPTSENLVYDAQTLQAAGSAYQVCDIDLTGFNWTPKQYYGGTYDGGGHKIKGLKVDAAPTGNNSDKSGKQGFGLFGSTVGNATLKNINLVEPEIKVDFTNTNLTDTCYVGALCGVVNPKLPEDELRRRVELGLPPGISEVVRKALMEDLMKEFTNTTSTIRGSKVEKPTIVANGENMVAGGLCGAVGDQDQKGVVKDSYVSEGSIAVNAANDDMKKKYENANVGGFTGQVSAGSVTNSYTTMNNVEGYVKNEKEDTATTPPTIIIVPKDIAAGFSGKVATGLELPAGVTATVIGCKTVKEGAPATQFTDDWPSWPLFNGGTLVRPDGWPAWPTQNALDYNAWGSMGHSSSTYPALIWESPFYVENK